MNQFSPQASDLLELWNCMSMNMRSVILRARYLHGKAIAEGCQPLLEQQLRRLRIRENYVEIGRQMREILADDGVQKEYPEPEFGADGPILGKYVDFRISEEAIPAIRLRLEALNERVLSLFISLCAIRLP